MIYSKLQWEDIDDKEEEDTFFIDALNAYKTEQANKTKSGNLENGRKQKSIQMQR